MEKFYGTFDESGAEIYTMENGEIKYVASYSFDNALIFKIERTFEEEIELIKSNTYPAEFIEGYLIDLATRKYNVTEDLKLINDKVMLERLTNLFNTPLNKIDYDVREEYGEEA